MNYLFPSPPQGAVYSTPTDPAVKYFTDRYLTPVLNMTPMQYAATLPTGVGYQGAATAGVVYQGVETEASYGTPIDLSGFALDDDDDDDDDDDLLGAAVADLALSGNYLKEKEDSKHRMGDLLASAWSSYDHLRNPGTYPGEHIGTDPKFGTLRSSAKSLGFYDWLDSVPEFQRITLINHPLMRSRGRNTTVEPGGQFKRGDPESGNLLPSMVVAFLKGVAYLDAVARKSYELEFPGGFNIRYQGGPLSTAEMRTVHSGRGFGIWVAGAVDARFYAGNHVKGRFHHSSFLAGANVICGGELVARAGKLRLLTAKTGHYQAGIDNFAKSIRILADRGIDPSMYRVMAWDAYGSFNAPINPAPLASELLLNPNGYVTWGRGVLPRDAWDRPA